MPGLLQYRHNLNNVPTPNSSPPSENSEDMELWLPSRLPTSHREQVCSASLPAYEEKLRTAQCYDALDTLRHVLRIKTRMVQFKNKNLRGQRAGTCSRAVIDRVHEQARVAADKYRVARKAKLALSGPGEWETPLRILEDGDVHSFQDPNRLKPRQGRRGILEDDQIARQQTDQVPVNDSLPPANFSLFNDERARQDGTGETRRTMSWIWLDHSLGEDGNDDILRAEWAKSRAQAKRATEEAMMVKEEMRRTIESLGWEAKEWEMRAASCSKEGEVLEPGLQEGLRA